MYRLMAWQEQERRVSTSIQQFYRTWQDRLRQVVQGMLPQEGPVGAPKINPIDVLNHFVKVESEREEQLMTVATPTSATRTRGLPDRKVEPDTARMTSLPRIGYSRQAPPSRARRSSTPARPAGGMLLPVSRFALGVDGQQSITLPILRGGSSGRLFTPSKTWSLAPPLSQ